ncbi:putative toxin-antitoxin system toxin component, PIN family [Tepidimonas taiwanensis]|uniref:putative toxin-antitoxin system toxin component, PIN family n=1 Tax=Tepidimonas taiwanensis TaxID=307486 RepID=UPI0009E67EFD|nr:putative toxin-antitoxin system toxin component, PIN family [Tepidimonas taiwanensis]
MTAGSTAAPRVVFDTNVVLSALLFRAGRLAPLRLAWQTGRIIPVVCRQTVQEASRVLAYPKFRLTAPEIGVVLAEWLPHAQAHPLPAGANDAQRKGLVCRDPHDQIFLELAFDAHADALVTGDDDLLTLAPAAQAMGCFAILTPAQMIETMPRRSG